MNKSISQRLVEFAQSLHYQDLPPDVIAKMKGLLLDTLGVAIGSTRLDFGVSALEVLSGWGGSPQSSVIGHATRVPARDAALYNGVLAHGQDYDDTHTESVVHPSAALVPVALAMAEREGRSGPDLLTAWAGGMEAALRIAMPARNKFHLRGFHTTSVCAPFGAALTAAHLQGLSADQTRHALGITGSFASGLLECVPAGAGSKRLHAGWAGQNGIVAAEFAKQGYTGPDSVFEGRLGFYNSLLRGEEVELDEIFDRLGQYWEILNVSPKLYPSCHYNQSFLDCAKMLRTRHGLGHRDIERIDCRVPQGAVNIVCEPWDKKIAPANGYDSRFSLPFAVALMLVKGKGGGADFSEESCNDPDIVACMAKVRYTVDPAYVVKDMPAWMEVTTTDGRKHLLEIPHGRGDALHPIDEEELLAKFKDNTEFLGAEKSQRLAELILGVDELADVGGLMKALREL